MELLLEGPRLHPSRPRRLVARHAGPQSGAPALHTASPRGGHFQLTLTQAAGAGEDAGAPWGRRSMRPALDTPGGGSSGAPVSSPATAAGGHHGPWASPPTVRRHGVMSRRRLPEGRRVRRRPARTPALHGAGAPWGRRSMRPALDRWSVGTAALQVVRGLRDNWVELGSWLDTLIGGRGSGSPPLPLRCRTGSTSGPGTDGSGQPGEGATRRPRASREMRRRGWTPAGGS